MRRVVLLSALLSIAAPAYADGARESRYGPATPRQSNIEAAARYDGPMLAWSNKRQPQPPVPPAQAVATAPTRPAPVAAWAGYRPAATTNPAPSPIQASAARLPDSLYATPQPPPGRQMAAATPPGGGAGVRFYSVGRASGLTPDAIPPAGADNRVLVIADQPPPPKDSEPMHGSADWLAAGARGDDGDDTGADRSKTRDQGL
ncbi:MAG: hypothetical protein J7521_06040 [Caulobacter sp.]|nr:hypothetical protein [Caulobacter sp.]